MGQGGVRGTETRCRITCRELRCPQRGLGTTVGWAIDRDLDVRHQFQLPLPAASQSVLFSQENNLLRVSLLTPGCLAEQWTGKKGDTAALGGKKSKKKSSRAKASSGGGSKQRKELGGLERDPSPEEDEGIQKASPLTHSPPDEL